MVRGPAAAVSDKLAENSRRNFEGVSDNVRPDSRAQRTYEWREKVDRGAAEAELMGVPAVRRDYLKRLKWIMDLPLGNWIAPLYKRFFKPKPIDATRSSVRFACEKIMKENKTNEAVMALEKGLDVAAPVRLLTIDNLGIGQGHFVKTFAPLFPEFEWDHYDVRRRWIEAMREVLDEGEDRLDDFKSYYLGNSDLESLQDLVGRLPAEKREALEKLQPWRQRAVANVSVSQAGDEEEIKVLRKAPELFEQETGADDIRTWPRTFQELPDSVYETEVFQTLARKIFEVVKAVRGEVKEIRITFHFMGVVARPDQEGDNAPEGAHKDNVDFALTALPVNIDNINGAESVVYVKPPDLDPKDLGPEHELYRRRLGVGEGLLMADEASEEYGDDLWHTVTRFKVVDKNRNGRRDIAGADVTIVA